MQHAPRRPWPRRVANANPIVSQIVNAAIAYTDVLTATFAGKVNQQDHSAARKALRAALRNRLDHAGADLAVFAVERYGSEVTAIITHTIERWDGKEAARRIELHVGRDLQFIRINGTIVGALAGLGIHALSQVAG